MTRLVLLLGVVVCSIGRPVLADDRERVALKLIEQHGGGVARDENRPGRPVVGLDLSGASVTRAELQAIGCLEELADLNLTGCHSFSYGVPQELARFGKLTTLGLTIRVTDDAVRQLAALPNLRALRLRVLATTDADVHKLGALKEKITGLDLSDGALTDAGVAGLADCRNLTHLDLTSCRSITDGGAKRLPALANLRALGLGFTGVTDAGVKELRALPELTDCDLRGTKTTGAALEHLRAPTKLTRLRVRGEEYTDDDMRSVARLKSLVELEVSACPGVTGRGFGHLVALPNLRKLDIHNSACDDATLKRLGPLKQLTHLDLGATNVTDAGLAHLAVFENLRFVSVGATAVTDAGIPALLAVRSLRSVDFFGCRVTDRGVIALLALPHLTNVVGTGTLGLTTDRSLRAFREAGRLHALPSASGRRGRPASTQEEVTSFLVPRGVTDEGINELAVLANLTDLYLPDTVTDDGLAALAPLKRLTYLPLRDGQVTDRTLRALRDAALLHAFANATSGSKTATKTRLRATTAEEVEWLDLSGTKVTDAGLKELIVLTNLSTLHLRGLKVTDAGVMSLRAALPKCIISR